jgi:predicted PurR-regulated permease PerM
MLKDAADLRRIFPHPAAHRLRPLRGTTVVRRLNAAMAAYIRAQCSLRTVSCSLCGLGFAALGLPVFVLIGGSPR